MICLVSDDNSLSLIARLASFIQRLQIALPATSVVVCSLFSRYQSAWIHNEMSQARYNSNVDQVCYFYSPEDYHVEP